MINLSLAAHQPSFELILNDLMQNNIVARIWQRDHTLWHPNPADIANRLGWLTSADDMRPHLTAINEFVRSVQNAGLTHALLLGMGGSSLAPEVFAKSFGVHSSGLDLSVLDSTHPDAIAAAAKNLDLASTLFIVATKSGGTVETMSLFKYFYSLVSQSQGSGQAGQQFVAITDPGSKLVDLAQEHNFRSLFLNDPNIGGRFSALSYFGLLPCALLGVDLNKLLSSSHLAMSACSPSAAPLHNPGFSLGAALGAMASSGLDKMALLTSPKIAALSSWIEQLVAESTGKNGQGILPVIDGSAINIESVPADCFFVHIHLADDRSHDATIRAIENAELPLISIHLEDIYELGAQFFIWEMATAIASHVLRIHPFNQPDVEAAKALSREMVTNYAQTGHLPHNQASSPSPHRLTAFLEHLQPHSFIAIQAYLNPDAPTSAALHTLVNLLHHKYNVIVTVGYGPRYLHSTGQLHKGDRGQGFFIQLISHPTQDIPIPIHPGKPDSEITFGILMQAQAHGDAAALANSGRQVLSFILGANPLKELEQLIQFLK